MTVFPLYKRMNDPLHLVCISASFTKLKSICLCLDYLLINASITYSLMPQLQHSNASADVAIQVWRYLKFSCGNTHRILI